MFWFNKKKKVIKLGDLYINKKTGSLYKLTDEKDEETINAKSNMVLVAKYDSKLYRELQFAPLNKTPEDRKSERAQLVIESLQSIKHREELEDEISVKQLQEIINGLFATVTLLQKKYGDQKAGV